MPRCQWCMALKQTGRYRNSGRVAVAFSRGFLSCKGLPVWLPGEWIFIFWFQLSGFSQLSKLRHRIRFQSGFCVMFVCGCQKVWDISSSESLVILFDWSFLTTLLQSWERLIIVKDVESFLLLPQIGQISSDTAYSGVSGSHAPCGPLEVNTVFTDPHSHMPF